MTKRHRTTAAIAVAGLVITGAHFVGATSAYADDPTPSVPPGTEPSASAPPPIRPDSPGLKLPQGGVLAPSRVLDMVEVVEDIGGEERRQETNQTVMMALQSEVMFPEDSAVFNAQAAARIQAIAQEINAQKATTIRVFGFTDDQGSYEHGKELSKKRADAVQAELAKTVTNPGVTFDVRGYSEDYPIADNGTEEGRKKNRRVEITFPRSIK